MFSKPTKDQAASLAGVFQSAMLVCQLANHNRHDAAALRSSVSSILRVDADSVLEVYGALRHLRLGFEVMERVFQGKLGATSRDLFQYSIGMYQLGGKLDSLPSIGEAIQNGLADINNRFPDADSIEQDYDQQEWLLYEDIAVLYAKTISILRPRIMVRGNQHRLNNPHTVNRVRSALFAGIRSAYLWQQLGGQRWQLLLHRKSYQSMARTLGS